MVKFILAPSRYELLCPFLVQTAGQVRLWQPSVLKLLPQILPVVLRRKVVLRASPHFNIADNAGEGPLAGSLVQRVFQELCTSLHELPPGCLVLHGAFEVACIRGDCR